MKDMNKHHRSLSTDKGKDTYHKSKPLVVKGGLTKYRTHYKNSGKYLNINLYRAFFLVTKTILILKAK